MHRIRTFCMTCALLLATGRALAQSEGNAAAEALFQQGRALFEAGKFAEGCPKLAESQRLDPATGTLLALALCHEGEGKLATAWAEFTTVEGQARRAGREDRLTIAREHAAALRPRLSTLTIVVAPEVAQTPGLEVRLDGVIAGSATFGVAVPIDGGDHRIQASAPGKQPFSAVVSVKHEADSVRSVIPALADAASQAPPAPRAAAVSSAPAADSPVLGSRLRAAALVSAGVGGVALGIGSYLALDAKSDYDAADELCKGETCPAGPHEATEDARSQGTLATVLFAVGGAAIATGAVLWFLPSGSSGKGAASAGMRLERVGLGLGGVSLAGNFQ